MIICVRPAGLFTIDLKPPFGCQFLNGALVGGKAFYGDGGKCLIRPPQVFGKAVRTLGDVMENRGLRVGFIDSVKVRVFRVQFLRSRFRARRSAMTAEEGLHCGASLQPDDCLRASHTCGC